MKFFKKIFLTVIVAIISFISLAFLVEYLRDNNNDLTKEQLSKDGIAITNEQNNLLYFFAEDRVRKDLPGNIIKVTASQLLADYNKNEVRADEIYRNKELIIIGTIRSIDRSIGKDYYLSLVTDEIFSSVLANFNDEQRSFLVGLHKGQSVHLHCEGDGMLIGVAHLKKCRPVNNWIQEEARLLQKKYKLDINKWLKKYLRVRMSEVQSNFNDNKNTLDFFNFTVLLLSTPDNNNYLSYERDLIYLKIPIEKIKLQYEEVVKTIFTKFSIENFNNITLEDYINIVKEEREKLLRKNHQK